MRGNLILFCVMSGLLGPVSSSERELSLLIYGAAGGFQGLGCRQGWKEGSGSCGSKKRLPRLLRLRSSLLFQTSHLNFPAAPLPSSRLTNNVCVYVPGLRRGLILGLEISLEVPICSDRETTMNRRACEDQKKRASGCLSGWWLTEPAAVAGVVVKGEGDGKERKKNHPQINKNKGVRKKMPPICNTHIFLGSFALC